jgi:ABC-type polysaccharide/polyol phosphate export permease
MTEPSHRPVRSRTARSPVMQETLRQVSLAWYFSWSDTRARYKRSVLGPFWLVLSTLIGVAGLGLVWSSLMNVERAAFIPQLTIGLVLWSLITGCVVGGCGVFVRRASIIKNIKTPAMRLSLELLFQQIVNFVHNMLVVVLILVVFPQPMSAVTLLAVPGLLLVLINLWWVVQVLGFLGARFRDLEPLVQAIMPIMFFVSPVLYRSHQLGPMEVIMAYNPMAYWLDVVREPLQGDAPTTMTWTVNILMAVVGWILAFCVTRAKAHRLAYWV